MALAFSYDLVAIGWAQCEFEVVDKHIKITASYLSDVLGSLSSAVVCLVKGQPEARASFTEEPGEYRWLFTRVDQHSVRVQVMDFAEWLGYKPDEQGRIILEATCDIGLLARTVLAELRRINAKYPGKAYREMWVEHDFPSSQMNELAELLRSEAPI